VGCRCPQLLGKRKILILDELPYMVEADPAMLSTFQYAWDQYFQKSDLVLALCGSQVHVMETLLSRQSPLFGRMTAQWHLEPLPFSSLKEFFPKWNADARVAAYAIVGGIPAYLNWLDPQQDLLANIRRVILKPGNMFLAEPAFLLYDELKEPRSYLAILKAIGSGAQTLSEISRRAFISSTSVNFYPASSSKSMGESQFFEDVGDVKFHGLGGYKERPSYCLVVYAPRQ
jgi:AAA+ ATPase superfamily predicted ATPase